MEKWSKLFKYPEIWVLGAVALLLRLVSLGFPRDVVFDEVYFRQFAADYLTGSYFFDIHPPLMKLIFAGVAWLFGFDATDTINGDSATVALRLVPALAGAALVPLVYVIARQLRLDRRMASLAAIMVLLDGALIVESRLVLMDSVLLLVGFGSLSAFLKLYRTQGRARWGWVAVAGLLTGVTVSIKWTGLAVLGLVVATWLGYKLARSKRGQASWTEMLVVCGLALAVYAGSFAVHFALLPQAGQGDAFMSGRFQSTLAGNPQYDPDAHMSFVDKFVELNHEMYAAQSTLNDAQHPYASKWYTWPLQTRPVYYWQGEFDDDGRMGNIYLLGNPAVWWTAAVGVLVTLLLWLFRPKLLGKKRRIMVFMLAGYALNYLPFAFIERPMFLYHYLFALIFSIFLWVLLVDKMFDWLQREGEYTMMKWLYRGFVGLVVLSFLYFVPFTYGIGMLPGDIAQHFWLSSWQ